MPKGQELFIPPPFGGARSDRANQLLELDECLDTTRNVYIKDGVLRGRPGYVQLGTSQPGGRIVGFVSYTDTASGTRVALASNLTTVYYFNGTNWVSRAGGLTGANADHVRLVPYVTAGSTFVIGVNDTDAPIVADDPQTNSFAALAGSPPPARDITVAANRIILGNVIESSVRRGSRIRISSANDHTSWPATLVVDLAATGDSIVAVEKLTRLNFAVYKEYSQWIGVAQSGAFPFRMELIDTKPGPISTAAVVPVGDVHYYLGVDYNVYRFDGGRCEAVGNAIKSFVQSNMTPNNLAHGCLWQDQDLVVFYDGGGTLGFGYNYKDETFWPLTFGDTITACLAHPFLTAQEMLVGTSGGTVMRSNDVFIDDDGTAIAYNWDTGALAPAGLGRRTRLDSLDVLVFDTGAQSHTITVAYDTVRRPSDAGFFTYAGGQTVDAATDGRLQVDFTDVEDRFISFRVSGSQASLNGPIRYDGLVLFYYTLGLD